MSLGTTSVFFKYTNIQIPFAAHHFFHLKNNWTEEIFAKQEKSGFCGASSMPEILAQHFIEITGVHCERLQDISDEDCLKSGVFLDRGKGTWERNPYVWVYEFKLLKIAKTTGNYTINAIT
jgi:hypothetical protein